MQLSLYENRKRGTKSLPIGFVRTHMTSKGPYIPVHWHEQIELQYIISGESIVTCARTEYNVSAGDFLIVNSYDIHSGLCTIPTLDAFVLVLDLNAFVDYDEFDSLLFQPLIKNDPKIAELMTSIFHEEVSREIGYIGAIKGKIYDLITYLIRNYKRDSVPIAEIQKNKQSLDSLDCAIDYIKQNYANPALSLFEIAQSASLSVSRFSHLFKTSIGLSPIAYLNQYRLEKAYHLLQDGHLKIIEIATLVGFSDYNNFNRQFQKLYHELPSKIRKKL